MSDLEGIAHNFRPYQSVVENLTNILVIKTEYDVVSCDWTGDGERFFVVVKKANEFFQIKQFCAFTLTLLFTRNLEGNYIKAQKMVQNKMFSLFCVCYLKDGQFNAVLFNKDWEIMDINLSKTLKLDEYNRPNDNFPYPHMDCCFLKDNTVFFNLYRTSCKTLTILKINPFTGEMVDQPWDYKF